LLERTESLLLTGKSRFDSWDHYHCSLSLRILCRWISIFWSCAVWYRTIDIWHFGGTYCSHLQGRRCEQYIPPKRCTSEDGGSGLCFPLKCWYEYVRLEHGVIAREATEGMKLVFIRLSFSQSANKWNSVLQESVIWKWYCELPDGALPVVSTHVSR
jgi:hypothetical protein